jgi:hypothetical protein
MRVLFFLILLALTAGCGKRPILYQRDPKWDLADNVYNNEIGKQVFSQLKKGKNLNVIQSDWALKGKEKICCMSCSFCYFNEVEPEQARELLLTAGDLYLKTINKNERIRPLLIDYPFTVKNIEVAIYFYNSKGKSPTVGKLIYAYMSEEKLRYRIEELDSQGLHKIIWEETYEEALDKLRTVDVSNTNQGTEEPTKFPCSEIFSPENGNPRPLHGKIVNGCYYVPKNVF